MTFQDKPTTMAEVLDNLTAENWHTEREVIEKCCTQAWQVFESLLADWREDEHNIIGEGLPTGIPAELEAQADSEMDKWRTHFKRAISNAPATLHTPAE